jgi:hypothetical protein
MRVMVLVKATEDSEKAFSRTPETMAEMGTRWPICAETLTPEDR